MGGPSQVLLSHWSGPPPKTPTPESGTEIVKEETDGILSAAPSRARDDCVEHFYLICIASASHKGAREPHKVSYTFLAR